MYPVNISNTPSCNNTTI